MLPRALSIRRVVLAGFVFLAIGRVNAQLAAKSPFMPRQAAASATSTADAPLEYRGYMETREGVQFRLYDPAKKAAAWVKLNERNPDFDVIAKQHDEEQSTLTLEYQGRVITLERRKAKVVSAGAAAQVMPPPVAPVQTNVAPAVTQAVVLNPTPADEQRRLDAVTAEVARRRALREQAAQQLGQGTPQTAQPQATPQPAQGNYQQQVPQNIQGGRGPGQTSTRQR